MARRDIGNTSSHSSQGFLILRGAYALLLIVAGIDKFLHLLTTWSQYLAPVITSLLPVDPEFFMYGAGIIEITIGIIVAVVPRYGGYLAAAWLLGIVFNLLIYSGWYDIALRDFVLALGTLALARLSPAFVSR